MNSEYKRVNTEDCIDCTRKHLASAFAAMKTLEQKWDLQHEVSLMGNLGQAEEQILGFNSYLAHEIRTLRLKIFEEEKGITKESIDELVRLYGHVEKSNSNTKAMFQLPPVGSTDPESIFKYAVASAVILLKELELGYWDTSHVQFAHEYLEMAETIAQTFKKDTLQMHIFSVKHQLSQPNKDHFPAFIDRLIQAFDSFEIPPDSIIDEFKQVTHITPIEDILPPEIDNIYIVGKGPSLDNLKQEDIPGDGIIFAINESIQFFKDHEFKQPVFALLDKELTQADMDKITTDLPLLVSNRQVYQDINNQQIKYDYNSLGVGARENTATIGCELAKLFNPKKVLLVAFDACSTGDTNVAESLELWDTELKKKVSRPQKAIAKFYREHCRRIEKHLKGVEHEYITPSMNDFTIITPTGDRPHALKLCRRWIERQTMQPGQWIVIDDGEKSSASIVSGLKYVTYKKRNKENSGHSLRDQMKEALQHVTTTKVIIMEDDDWYAAGYCEHMIKALDEHKIYGLSSNMLYHFTEQRYAEKHSKRSFAWWAATAFRSIMIPDVLDVLGKMKQNDMSVDNRVWKALRSIGKLERPKEHLMVGMKGMPGRVGLSPGQNPGSIRFKSTDNDYKVLGEVIGKEVDHYKGLLNIIDVVIPFGAGGSIWNDNELRYALRSIEKYMPNVGDIYIATDRPPKWLTGVQIVDIPDKHKKNKDANLIDKVLACCKIPEISQMFMRWSDDQVLLDTLIPDKMLPRHGSMSTEGMHEGKAKGNNWHKRMANNVKLLKSHGKRTVNWDTHLPQPIDKDKFIEVMESIDYANIGYTINTTYFNMINEKPIYASDIVKATIEGKVCCGGITKAVKNKLWLGYNNAGLQSGVKSFLIEKFPDKSKYENDIPKQKDPGYAAPINMGSIVPPQEETHAAPRPQKSHDTIDSLALLSKRDKILDAYPQMKLAYETVEEKKKANPRYKMANLIRYFQPVFMQLIAEVQKNPEPLLATGLVKEDSELNSGQTRIKMAHILAAYKVKKPKSKTK